MIENGVRHRRWGRRLGWAAVTLIGTAFIAHMMWGAIASRGVQARVAALQAAGEPILPADFATPPTGPDNGGDDLLAAGEAIEHYAKANRAYADLDPALPLRPQERNIIRAALSDRAAPLAQFEAGLAKPRRDWDTDLSKPVIDNMLPSLNGIRALCILLARDALLQHENGDHAAALRRLDQILDVARFADQHPSLVGHLVSIGCTALACHSVMEIAPDLKIGAAPGDASPQQVRAMIDRLLDDGPPRAGLRLALRGERMFQLEMVRSVQNRVAIPAGGPGKPTRFNPVALYFVGPVLNRNASVMLDYMTRLVPLADEPDLPAAMAKMPPSPKRGNPLNLLADILLPSLDRAFHTHYRAVSDRRLAAAALAVRGYQLDHANERPARLQDLVPTYLPTLPTDALLRDAPLGYLPDAQPPRLYSAGENGVDDGGSDALARPYPDGRPAGRGDEWRTLDRCVYLDRQPRPPPDEEFELSDGVGDLGVDENREQSTTAPTTPP